MIKKVKLMLLAGCLVFSSVTVPVYGDVSLEESMLKPPSKSDSKKASSFDVSSDTVTEAVDLLDLSQAERVEEIGKMCQADYEKTGVLASVSAAQCILESGYLGSELATNANNCFGMKTDLSSNNWEGSSWDGESVYTKTTGEEYNGKYVTVQADFREYDSIEDSIADHSAYLLGAEISSGKLRYEGLAGETDYRTAIQIIKDGGYATSSSYVDNVCRIIEKFDLTRFDQVEDQNTKTKAGKNSNKNSNKNSGKNSDKNK